MNDPAALVRETLGQQLSAARESRGLSRHNAADALHLPLAVVEALESDRLDRLGAPVYVRGHLRSYLRLLALPAELADQALPQAVESMPALHTTVRTPTMKYLTDRYAMRAVYVLLTLSIIVPALWVATQHEALQRGARSLDVAPLALDPSELADAATVAPARPVENAASGERETVVASMAPFYASARAEADAAPSAGQVPVAAVQPATAVAEDGWLLRFTEDSWVEVIGQDGRRLEYGLVRADSERRFKSGSVARVALGNAGGVEIHRAGEALDLQPYRRANVARFAVSSDGALRPASE